jgi:hypothetical protein
MSPTELSNGVFDEDLQMFFEIWDVEKGPSSMLMNERKYSSSSFADTVLPMLHVLNTWRGGDKNLALENTKMIKALDWRIAAQQWMQRRLLGLPNAGAI